MPAANTLRSNGQIADARVVKVGVSYLLRPLPVRRFKLVPFQELTPSTTATYLVKGIIPRVGIVAVWGPPKCGKSFWTFDLAMHSALGREYRGRRVIQGTVVYCAFEGADGFKARAAAF